MNPRELRRHRSNIVAFHSAYEDYIKAGPEGDPALRARVVELLPGAQRGLDRAGIQPTMYPPRALGGPARRGLPNLAFAHETSSAAGADETIGMVRDSLQLAAARFEEWADDEEGRGRNPLSWIDSGLRAFLELPAYIVRRVRRQRWLGPRE